MRTRNFTVPTDCRSAARVYDVAAPVMVSVPIVPSCRVTSTSAEVCAVPSGWFGVHRSTSAVFVGATAPWSHDTVGASGGVIVVTSFDVVYAPNKPSPPSP